MMILTLKDQMMNWNDFIAFTIFIFSVDSSSKTVSENLGIDEDGCDLNKNMDIYDTYNKLCKVLLILKKQNVKLRRLCL